jgi:HSP20 family protein
MARLPVRRVSTDIVPTWDPMTEMSRLANEMMSILQGVPGFAASTLGLTPAADVEETNDAYLVEVELPGVSKGDVSIEVAGRRLSVRAERKERERVGMLRRRTRLTGQLQFEILLPGEVDTDNAEATLSDGVLQLRLPKPSAERPRRISVK